MTFGTGLTRRTGPRPRRFSAPRLTCAPRLARATRYAAPRPGPPSGAGAGLVRVVEGEADHGCRDALAVAVQLADVHGRADLRVLNRHPAQRDVLAQDRRPGPAGD